MPCSRWSTFPLPIRLIPRRHIMNVKRKSTESDSSGDKAKAMSVAVLLTAAMLVAGAAEADKAKPEPRPAETVTINFQKIEFTPEPDDPVDRLARCLAPRE